VDILKFPPSYGVPLREICAKNLEDRDDVPKVLLSHYLGALPSFANAIDRERGKRAKNHYLAILTTLPVLGFQRFHPDRLSCNVVDIGDGQGFVSSCIDAKYFIV